jgi:hypothetical protein
VHIVRVLDPAGTAAAAQAVVTARSALQVAANRLAGAHPELAVTAEIAVGLPAAELARIADRDALLVIGASRKGRMRSPDARRVPVAIAGRGVGVTAVVPADGPDGRAGVVAVVRGRSASRGALAFAARAARALEQPLTLVRIRDPFEPVDGEPVTLEPELRSLARDYPELAVRLDPRWVRSPISLLTHSDHALLLVLEAGRPTSAPPRFSLERWLAGEARAPFVAVAETAVQEEERAAARRDRLTLIG